MVQMMARWAHCGYIDGQYEYPIIAHDAICIRLHSLGWQRWACTINTRMIDGYGFQIGIALHKAR